MNSFQHFFRSRLVFFLALVILLLLGISLTFAFTGKTAPSEPLLSSEKRKPKIQTISPLFLEKETSPLLLGSVLSNETANVYPRRNGIVEDILVDIGDVVNKGQTLAFLLPPGVEGKSQALLAEKQARVSESHSRLTYAEKISDSTIDEYKEKIAQKRTELQSALLSRGATSDQAETSFLTTGVKEDAALALSKQKKEVAQKNLELMSDRLDAAKKSREEKIRNAEKNISQKIEQAKISFLHAQESIDQIVSSGSTDQGRRRNESLHSDSFPYEIGFYDPQLRIALASSYNILRNTLLSFSSKSTEKQEEEIPSLFADANTLLSNAQHLVQSSSPSLNLTEARISSLSDKIHDAQTGLLKAQESVEDAVNALRIVISTEDENIIRFEKELEQRNSLLLSADQEITLARSSQEKNTEVSLKNWEREKALDRSTIENLKAEIRKAERELDRVIAQQGQQIDQAKSSLQVARSMLSVEASESGNQEIKSPFSGTVAKRFLMVGELASSSSPAFELIDVETSLSKKAKREIQFGLPEDLVHEISVGDRISFFLSSDDQEIYEAEVTRKSPQVDAETHTISVQAKLADDLSLPHNTSVRIRLSTEQIFPYRLPSSAIKREAENNIIWEVLKNEEEEKQVRKISITVLAQDGEFAEVMGDLHKDMKILVNPADAESFPLFQNNILDSSSEEIPGTPE